MPKFSPQQLTQKIVIMHIRHISNVAYGESDKMEMLTKINNLIKIEEVQTVYKHSRPYTHPYIMHVTQSIIDQTNNPVKSLYLYTLANILWRSSKTERTKSCCFSSISTSFLHILCKWCDKRCDFYMATKGIWVFMVSA